MDDDAIADFIAGRVPTSQAVRDRIDRAAWTLDEAGGAGDRVFDWIKARAARAVTWLEGQADGDGRVDLDDALALRDMLAADADQVAVWMHAAGARAGGEEAVRQLREHHEAGRHPALVLAPERPEPQVDEYAAADPRTGIEDDHDEEAL